MDAGHRFLEGATDLRLVLFGGKGGVGKTTCATAAALSLAEQQPDRRFLLASTDPAHSVRLVLGEGPLPSNLAVLEVDAAASLQRFQAEYGERLRDIVLRGTVLQHGEVTELLGLSLPGLDELMAFLEIAEIVETGAADCVVVDTAPMGHTMRFLALPDVMGQWLDFLDALLAKHRFLRSLYGGGGEDALDALPELLRRKLEGLAALLTDPERTRFIPVLLTEHLSVRLTSQLVEHLRRRGMRVTDVVVNRLLVGGPGCVACIQAERRQRRQVRRLAPNFPGCGLWEGSLWPEEVRGPERLRAFWAGLHPLRQSPEDTTPWVPLVVRAEQPLPGPPASARLLLFAGKGGVGKTTMACAAALHLNERWPGREVLLFSVDPAHALASCLNTPIGGQITRLRPGLSAIEVDTAGAFDALKKEFVEEIRSRLDRPGVGMEFDRAVLEQALDLAPPGLDEIMALEQVVALLESRRFAVLVLDTAPAGHLVRLLELPHLLRDWIRVLFRLLLRYERVLRLPRLNDFLVSLSKGLKALSALLADPGVCRLYTVSVLTELAFEKTVELVAGCRRVGVEPAGLILNQAVAENPCPVCTAQRRQEGRVRQRFADALGAVPQVVVERGTEPLGLERLTDLGRSLFDGAGASALVGYSL